MEYRRLGSAGVKVSELSFGSWVTFQGQLDDSQASECMKLAYDSGVNFFDNAEVYAAGEAEAMMGRVLKKMGWRRASYLVSTKFYWGLNDGPNERNTLNRKYLRQAIDGSLKRLQLDYVDLVFCHRPDPHTPIEETVRAMHDMIERGQALYWGTSEWGAKEIRDAYDVAERYGFHRPQMEQPQYNMFIREKVEQEFHELYSQFGLGTTVWSPLASGLLSGKYSKGIPAGSRATLPGYEWLRDRMISPEKIEKVNELAAVAHRLGCTMAQLAIAWCLKNRNVSTVLLGATSTKQLKENLGAAPFKDRLDDDVMAEIEKIVG